MNIPTTNNQTCEHEIPWGPGGGAYGWVIVWRLLHQRVFLVYYKENKADNLNCFAHLALFQPNMGAKWMWREGEICSRFAASGSKIRGSMTSQKAGFKPLEIGWQRLALEVCYFVLDRSTVRITTVTWVRVRYIEHCIANTLTVTMK